MRYLFGPVDRNFAEQNLAEERAAGRCVTFGSVSADVTIGADDLWADVETRLPEAWKPDCIFLYAQYAAIPEAIWQAGVPIIGIAGDWNLLWHGYRSLLRRCDLVLADAMGVEKLTREGVNNVHAATFYGAERRHFEIDATSHDRDIDVLFVGNFNPAIHDERLRLLRRVAESLPDRKVLFTTGVFGDDYVRLLRRSRIVFNHSVRGEWNLRCSEALAAGSLLFLEAGNLEAATHLRPAEYVAYEAANLETLLRRYVEDETERAAVAARGHARAAEFSFETQWKQTTARIEKLLTSPKERKPADLAERVWTCISASGHDPQLQRDLDALLGAHPRSSRGWHLRASLLAWRYQRPEDFNAIAEAYQHAWKSDPRNVVAGLALAEMLWRMRLKAETIEQAERTLSMLRFGSVNAFLDLPPYPTRFDRMRCEWERAAWAHVGDADGELEAKKRLLQWRLQSLLAEATGDVQRAFAAVLERPDLPESRVALGELLLNQGQFAEAAEHLVSAHYQRPFHANTAALAYRALSQSGQTERHVKLASMMRRLAETAPGIVALEPWAANAGMLPPQPRTTAASKVSIAWEGEFEGVASLANVNRNLSNILVARGHHVTLVPKPGSSEGHRSEIRSETSEAIQVHVAHQWPPRFERPKAERWVLMQPWEFGSIPRAWVDPIRTNVDEVWVPSRFVRNCFINSGLPADKVHVVPNGFASSIVGDRSEPFPLQTTKRFKFLFVGGTIPRKGIDLLLTAYGRTFDASDDVCLVIKEMGRGTFYRGQTADDRIAEFRKVPGAPAIEVIDNELSETQMASLYAACDCLIHPFRGEGFGMPILEATANGLPTIVTGFGPVLDFCNAETSYLLPAKAYHLSERRIGEIETVDLPFLAEPDGDALAATMKHVVDDPEEAAAKGMAAKRIAFERFTWEHAADAVEQRLTSLVSKPGSMNEQNVEFGPGSVSLCLIVKNEEKNLGDCLTSVRGLVSEIVVVDTGSSDRTREIAREHGARVFEFPWIDDFAAARNETLRHARGEWILWMDADDRIDPEHQTKLRDLLRQLDGRSMGYVMKCRCLPDHDTGTVTIVDHVRLFRRHPDVRWKYRIHEQILPSIRRLGGDVAWSEVVIDHVGYQDSAVRSRKLQRDLRLLELENRDQPNDPFTLFNLGMVYQEIDRIPQALDSFRRSLRSSHPSDSIVRKLYSLIAQCERQLDHVSAALDACQEGRGHYPHDPEILFQEGLARTALGDLAGAEACYIAAMAPSSDRHFASIDVGIRSYKARHNLAVLYRDQGRLEEAEQQWRVSIAESPDFVPAWSGLAELLLRTGRLQSVKDLLSQMPHDRRFALERDRLNSIMHTAS